MIGFDHLVKPEIHKVVHELRLGGADVKIMTHSNKAWTQQIAEKCGIRQFESECLEARELLDQVSDYSYQCAFNINQSIIYSSYRNLSSNQRLCKTSQSSLDAILTKNYKLSKNSKNWAKKSATSQTTPTSKNSFSPLQTSQSGETPP